MIGFFQVMVKLRHWPDQFSSFLVHFPAAKSDERGAQIPLWARSCPCGTLLLWHSSQKCDASLGKKHLVITTRAKDVYDDLDNKFARVAGESIV